MINVKNLNYEYPQLKALDNVSFQVSEGSITALVGPNGAGKTTLLRNLATLQSPFSGEIYLNGIDVINNAQKVKGIVSYLPDHFGLYTDLTAYECILYSAWSHGLKGKHAEDALIQAVKQVDLASQLMKKAGSLSRGQRQRLALAQCIVYRPKILLLDEPASGLDPDARENLSLLFKALAKDGMTLIVSSHILSELENYCTDMLVLEQGKIRSHQYTQKENSLEHQLIDLEIAIKENEPYTLDALCAYLLSKDIQCKRYDDKVVCEIAQDFELQNKILQDLVINKWPVISFNSRKKSLADIYKNIVNPKHSNEGV